MASIATHAASLWYEAADELDTPTAAHSVLRRVLDWTLGEEAEVGIAYQNNEPVIVAMENSRLICVRPEDPAVSNSEAIVSLDSIPLDAALRVKLSISQQTHGRGTFMVKSWRIGGPDTDPVQVDTRTPISQLQGGEYGGRVVVEKAVTRLGWTLSVD